MLNQPLTEVDRQNVIKYDRDMVNHETKHNPRPCLEVSEEFFWEMCECVPPVYFGTTDNAGCYSMMQVGEPMRHDAQGNELYETFQRMNQAAIDQNLADSRMRVGVWYFTGLRKAYDKDRKQ